MLATGKGMLVRRPLCWFVRYKRFGKFKALFDESVPTIRPLSTFPRIIHLYWDQGFDEAPEVVRLCVQSWVAHHPGWTIRYWQKESASEIVPVANLPEGLGVTPYSDILRTELLKQYGGVWADATVYCTRPLDGWLPQIMLLTDFFAFSRPGKDRVIASWFLAARPNTAFLQMLSDAIRHFWSAQEKPTRVYHWVQYVFEYLLRTSGTFRHEWACSPTLSAMPMLAAQEELTGGASDQARPDLYAAVPMHKLTHKKTINPSDLEALLGTR
jgi:hypothetical protein